MNNFPLWLVFIILCFEALIIALLVPGEVTDRTISSESKAVYRVYGSETYMAIYDRSNDAWRRHIVDSGVLDAIAHHLLPDDQQRTNDKAFSGFASPWFVWVRERIDALSNAYFFVQFRFSQLALWAPYFAVLFLPALYDGVCAWRIKRTNFAYISPALYQILTGATLALIMLIVGLFMAPIELPPVLMPSSICLACLMIGILIGHVQKRI